MHGAVEKHIFLVYNNNLISFQSALIDGIDVNAMSREQLEKFALNLRSEVEREREERNYFQLERDQLRTFWEITKNQLGKFIIFNQVYHCEIQIDEISNYEIYFRIIVTYIVLHSTGKFKSIYYSSYAL